VELKQQFCWVLLHVLGPEPCGWSCLQFQAETGTPLGAFRVEKIVFIDLQSFESLLISLRMCAGSFRDHFICAVTAESLLGGTLWVFWHRMTLPEGFTHCSIRVHESRDCW
jgi:hypothetical protein